jgi:hypothetical protein
MRLFLEDGESNKLQLYFTGLCAEVCWESVRLRRKIGSPSRSTSKEISQITLTVVVVRRRRVGVSRHLRVSTYRFGSGIVPISLHLPKCDSSVYSVLFKCFTARRWCEPQFVVRLEPILIAFNLRCNALTSDEEVVTVTRLFISLIDTTNHTACCAPQDSTVSHWLCSADTISPGTSEARDAIAVMWAVCGFMVQSQRSLYQ